MRLAARPVGAAKTNANLARRRIVNSAVNKVVLPVPGPPVITRHFFLHRLLGRAHLIRIQSHRRWPERLGAN